MTNNMFTWAISAVATLGVIVRPLGLPEAIWAVAGALLLVVLGLIPAGAAWTGVGKGVDVYLFLIGMMLLSEIAREEGLFDWLAAKATAHAEGSPIRLFALIYLVGVLVTVFLSNDATTVVLTPAVCAATRAAKVKNPKPYLLICAFTANATFSPADLRTPPISCFTAPATCRLSTIGRRCSWIPRPYRSLSPTSPLATQCQALADELCRAS